MSRTYRRKSGYRPFDSAQYKDEWLGRTWNDGQEETFERYKKEFHLDGKWDSGYKSSLKWATNYHRRADKRMDLTQVFKVNDYEDLDLYDRKHDYKKLIWIYL